jgi:hypothetical protein
MIAAEPEGELGYRGCRAKIQPTSENPLTGAPNLTLFSAQQILNANLSDDQPDTNCS